jgi:hypothetical protein
MYCGRDYSPQENGESEVLGLDFVNDIDHDEVLISSVWDISVIAGVDANPTAHLQGPSVVIVPKDGSVKTGTIQRVGGIVPGVTYRVRAQVITTRGNIRSLWSHIRGVTSNT